MRWPSDSCRTGVRRNGSRSSRSRKRLEVALVALGRDAIDVAQQLERVDQRQVPPQLGALAEDHADALGDLLAPAVRHHAEHFDVPAAGDQNAGQHLDRGRLAGAVRPQAADHLAALDPERHVAHGAHLAVLAVHQRAHRAEQPAPMLGHAKRLFQPLTVDARSGHGSGARALVVPHALLPAEARHAAP